jgi:hypothetical protein
MSKSSMRLAGNTSTTRGENVDGSDTSSTFLDEVFVFLKQRKRTLSLHTLHDFIGMEKHENFSYEVLFGDNNAISQMLGEPQRV